jgi:LmbE family N-acetylglucosaminyl deacetylase
MKTHRDNQSSPGRPAGPAEIGVLLGVWAHPDDEAYLTAGLMSVTRAAGLRVVVATATRGERGTDDPVALPPERLALIRERENAASLAALDVREHRWLGHRDGTLHRVRAAAGVAQVTRLIQEIRPDTIVTFGPDGMTGHTDHQTISRWVTAAWADTGRHGRLWYATLTPEYHQQWAAVNSEIGLWFEGSTPPSDLVTDLAFAVRCEGELLDRKFAALRAYTSQTTGLIEHLGVERYRRWWATESFVDASRRRGHRAAA